MDTQDLQVLLEKRLESIWRAGVADTAVIQNRFGPIENWQMSLGNHLLLLHPVKREWYYFDRLHQVWAPSGLKPGMGRFVLVNERLGARLHRPAVDAPTIRSGRDAVFLVVEIPDQTAKKVALGDARILVGREESADVRLPHPLVSRSHAALEPTPQGWIVRDLQSANGTYVNGKRLEDSHLLQPGDMIQVGDSRIFFTTGTLLAEKK